VAANITWEQSADSLLERRDRFTQKAIRDDFSEVFQQDLDAGLESPTSTSIEFDPDNQGYLTPVADQRYSVVWYLEQDASSPNAVVRAVVPTARFDRKMKPTDLHDRLSKIVAVESRQTVKLK
jgi:hypothetical protein